MDKAIIVDIDGTLADISHRIHLLVGRDSKDWCNFESGCVDDGVYEWAANLVRMYKGAGYKILLVSGRTESVRGETERWLKLHNIPYDELHLRPVGNFISDCELKQEVYISVLSGKYSIEFVVEDRARVVSMWRRNGLTCLACAEGDY